VVPDKIDDRLISTEELLAMNLKRPDASPDELLRRNEKTDQQLRHVRRVQDPLKEYGPTSAGVFVAISLYLS
jgi:hypothetical protein